MPPAKQFDVAGQDYPCIVRRVKATGGLSQTLRHHILGSMKIADGSTLVANLTTIGRKSGEPRTVELRFLYFKGNFYATSGRVEGKHWCQNMLKNPAVTVATTTENFPCLSSKVDDEKLRKQVLTLRDSPAQLDRVVFEIRPKA